MQRKTTHLILNCVIAALFLLGFIPIIGSWFLGIAIAVAVVELVITFKYKDNDYKTSSIIELISAVVGLIPVLGYVFVILGLVFAILAIIKSV